MIDIYLSSLFYFNQWGVVVGHILIDVQGFIVNFLIEMLIEVQGVVVNVLIEVHGENDKSIIDIVVSIDMQGQNYKSIDVYLFSLFDIYMSSFHYSNWWGVLVVSIVFWMPTTEDE